MSVAELKAPVLEREHQQTMLAICLTMTAGYLDGYGLLVLGSYVSFMSGKTTMAGGRIGQGNLLAALSPAIPFLLVVGGGFAANVITHFPFRYSRFVLLLLLSSLCF